MRRASFAGWVDVPVREDLERVHLDLFGRSADTKELQRLGRAVIWLAVSDWRPGHRLSIEQAERVGRLFTGVLGEEEWCSGKVRSLRERCERQDVLRRELRRVLARHGA